MRPRVANACVVPALFLFGVVACGTAPGPAAAPARASLPPPVVAVPPAASLPAPLGELPVIDEASAGSLWAAVTAPVAPISAGTFEALAIRPRTRWGRLAISWAFADETTYDALMIARRGPYFPTTDRKVLSVPGADAHVVTVTGSWIGLGGPSDVALTEVRVLPIDPSKLLDDAAARWNAYLSIQAAAIEAGLAEADRLTGGPKFGAERTQNDDRFAPSWLPATRELEVIYVRKVTRSSAQIERIGGGGCNKYRGRGGRGKGLASFPAEAPVRVACPPPRVQTITHTRAYSVDVGLVVRYRADGTLVEARPYAPQRVPGRLETKGEGGDL